MGLYMDIKTAISLTDEEIDHIKNNMDGVSIIPQRGFVSIIRARNNNKFFRGLVEKYPQGSTIGANGMFFLKVLITTENVSKYRGWLVKTLRDILCEDISNSYSGDIKILPAQEQERGVPEVWRIRAGTKEHFVFYSQKHICDLRRGVESGKKHIGLSVDAGFDLWNKRESHPTIENYWLIHEGLTVEKDTFTNEWVISTPFKRTIAKNLIELFYHVYIGHAMIRNQNANDETFALPA